MWCQEVLLSPGEEARVGTKQMLSRMVANYLMIGVWGQGEQLAGLARLPASSLHWGPAAGQTDNLMVAAVKLAEVVQKGEVVVLLQLVLWASTLDYWRGEGRQWRGEEAWGGHGDNDRLLEGDPT